MRPKLSVVMPHWNQQHLIKNAIESILNQTFQDWELIIVDDGSSDFTLPHIVKEFDDNRIKLLEIPHQGLVTARNFGIEMAKAPIIVTQDSDDLSMPDRLEKIYNNMKGFDVLIHSAYSNWWNDKNQCIHREYIRALPVDKERLKKEQYLPGWPAFRKELWLKKPFRYETEYAYDWMMHIDWVFSGAKYKVLDEGLYEYVRHQGSISHQFEKDGRRQKSMEKIKGILKNEYGN